MKLRAKLTVRNDVMLTARKRLGLSQFRLAEILEIPSGIVVNLERLDYSTHKDNIFNYADLIADFLKIDVKDILPPNLEGKNMMIERTVVSDVAINQIESFSNKLALPPPEEEFDRKETAEMIQSVMEYYLTDRERLVLNLRYGLNGSETHSLQEASKIVKVTTERLRQIEVKAIRKMQHPTRARKLIDCVPDGSTTYEYGPELGQKELLVTKELVDKYNKEEEKRKTE